MRNSLETQSPYTNYFNCIFPTWEHMDLSGPVITHGEYYWEGTTGDWAKIPDWTECMVIPDSIVV